MNKKYIVGFILGIIALIGFFLLNPFLGFLVLLFAIIFFHKKKWI